MKKSAAASETVRVLQEDVGGHYSMLTTRHVHAIVAENLDREQKARGRKRNRDFEAFVWAKLMFVLYWRGVQTSESWTKIRGNRPITLFLT